MSVKIFSGHQITFMNTKFARLHCLDIDIINSLIFLRHLEQHKFMTKIIKIRGVIIIYLDFYEIKLSEIIFHVIILPRSQWTKRNNK